MECIAYRIPLKRKREETRIYFISDTHYGSAGCDIEKLREDVREIQQDKNAFWLGLGDYIEGINVTDKRFDPFSIDPKTDIKDLSDLARTEMRRFVNVLLPIQNKCIGLLRGNHEETLRHRYFCDVFQQLVMDLKTRDLSENALIHLLFDVGNRNCGGCWLYIQHGSGGGRKTGGMINKLEDCIAYLEADVYVCGHAHRSLIDACTRIEGTIKGNPRLVVKDKILMLIGGRRRNYKQGIVDYSNKSFYSPTPMRFPVLILKVAQNKKCEADYIKINAML